MEIVHVRAHHYDVFHVCSLSYYRAYADNAAFEHCVAYEASVGDVAPLDPAAEYAGAGQKPAVGIDGLAFFIEVERGNVVRQCEICVEKRAYGADVLPIAVEDVRAELLLPSIPGMTSLPKSISLPPIASSRIFRENTYMPIEAMQ